MRADTMEITRGQHKMKEENVVLVIYFVLNMQFTSSRATAALMHTSQ